MERNLAILLSLTALSLAACSGNSDKDQVERDAKRTQEREAEMLNRVAPPRSEQPAPEASSEPEPQASEPPVEPDPVYEDVEVYNISQVGSGGRDVCAKLEVEPCGVSASDCQTGSVYVCMHNVVYKVTTEKRQVN